MRTALIDGDLITYKFAHITQGGRQAIRYLIDKFIHEDILEATNSNHYRVFLTGPSNFRRDICPTYKAHRPTERPEWYDYCREWMQQRHRAVMSDGCEADDLLGINQRDNTIICSLDKDLLQIPGKHYSWPIIHHGEKVVREAIFHDISEEEGERRFYTQMLLGDVSDNIKGVYGIGPKKAEKLLNDSSNMKETVRSLYDDEERFLLTGDLLWIWRDWGMSFSVLEEMND